MVDIVRSDTNTSGLELRPPDHLSPRFSVPAWDLDLRDVTTIYNRSGESKTM